MKPKVSIIAIVARNGAIGRDGDQPFHISEDFRRFKALTLGHPIIMGRKTFEALPKGALPGRRNIVISRNAQWNAPNTERASSIEEAIAMCNDIDEIFIIGGGLIYSQTMPLCDCLYITEVDADVTDADTFFPEINSSEWQPIESSDYAIDPRSSTPYHFTTYSRKG